MPRKKIQFNNAQGEPLAALFETPNLPAKAYALFAHCFTCSKDIAAASRISRALAEQGIATLRFDFTGLGNSDGDFSNTNFSSNLQDLHHAAAYMTKLGMAPDILIGHSLGGAAILAASQQITTAKVVVTIAAPATGQHIEHLFVDRKTAIESQTSALVDLAGRQFKIKKQFLKDIAHYNDTDHIAKLGKALLVFHSPLDNMVSINEASKIYSAAKHPKSFISLDKADHLLSKAKDAEYVATMISTWVSRYLELPAKQNSPLPTLEHGDILVREIDHKFTCLINTQDHQLIGDEPITFGGQNKGPSPYEFLLSALGLCTAMTIRMVAKRENIPLEDAQVALTKSLGDKTADGKQPFLISRKISLLGDLEEDQYLRLMSVADRCPVHKSLRGDIQISTVSVT